MLISNAELWFPRLVPEYPNKKYDRQNPSWEIQIRTADPEQRKEWESQGLNMKAVVPDDGSPPFWKCTLRKKQFNSEGEERAPVEVVGGDKKPIDPGTIGNGSVGNVRVYQYEYGEDKRTASMLMGVQLTKHIVYKRKPREDDWEDHDMETIQPDDDEDENEEQEEKKPAKKSPTAPRKSKFD